MQAIEITAPSIDALRRVERDAPAAPGPGRILVRMKAGSLNFADLAVATGNYPGALYPNIALCDGAGEVVAVGNDVWQVAVGDRVAVHIKARWTAGKPTSETANAMRGATLPGSLIEIADVAASSVVKAPAHLSWEEIGTLPICAMTAWKALETGQIGPGSTVVLLGTGGVSIFALQLAKARGARVMITSSSDAKLERARALGADLTHNYRQNPDWDAFVLRNTGGIGADLVLDPVGGEGLGRSIAAVRQAGAVCLVGLLGGITAPLELLPIIFKEVRLQGSNGGSVADLANAVAAIDLHGIHPVIDRIFDLGNLAEGYRVLSQAGHFGKLAVRFDW